MHKTKNYPRTGRYAHRSFDPKPNRAYRLTDAMCSRYNLDGPLFAIFYANRRAVVYRYNSRTRVGRILGLDWNIRPTAFSLKPKDVPVPHLSLRPQLLDSYSADVLESALPAVGHLQISILEA